MTRIIAEWFRLEAGSSKEEGVREIPTYRKGREGLSKAFNR
jgi:hypothetical protein